MGLNERLCAAVTPIVSVCVPERYEAAAGETPAAEYCTYNYYDLPRLVAEGRPRRIVRVYQLHYVCPAGGDPEPKKLAILKALVGAGFSAPGVVDATGDDETVQHWVFEFEGRFSVEYGEL